MASVDDRVVNMRFNNSTFEQGAKTSLNTLDKLKNALNFSSSKKGLDDLQTSSNKFNLGGLGANIEGISAKFLALGTIGVTALANIANRAVNAGATLVKSLTIAPITQGFSEYETKLGSIQTILANTARFGTKLPQVNAALNELNAYADKTIYNFGDMTKNIGLFTNAGIRVEDATSMIKGFSNAAAASGTNAQGAAGAAYQLSQALSTGTIRLMDWRSLTNVGMGNKNMQEGLINIAQAMGTIEKSGTTASAVQKDFNGSLQKGWLSADVMSKYLRIMAGDMDEAKMKSMGLSDAQIKNFLAQAKTAEDAATKVRTLTQLIGTAKEAVGSGWSQTFEILFGNFTEATDLFTMINNSVSGFISNSANARNKVLADWKALGGRKDLIEGIKAVFVALGSVIKPIKEAFRDIFPPKTGRDLYEATRVFKLFMQSLKMGGENSENLKRTFRGLFAIFDIGKKVIIQVVKVITSLFGSMSGGASSLLNFTGNLGDWLVALDEAITKGEGFYHFFNGLAALLQVPIQVIKGLGQVIAGMFDGFRQGDATGVADALGQVGDKLSEISEFGQKVHDFFAKIGHALQPLAKAVTNAFGSIGTSISNSLQNLNFDQVMDVIQTGLFGGLILLMKKFFANGFKVDIGGGMLESVKGTFEALTGKMKAMQTQVKAKTLLMIAGAIALLTASVVTLSMIDSKRLTVALKAMAAGFGELLGSMAILTKLTGPTGFTKIPLIAGSMILLATAVDVLTLAVIGLAKLPIEELKKGLTAVGILLGEISLATIPLSANSAGMVRAGIGITAISVAMNLLYFAVKNFSTLKWEELGKGLTAVGGLLATLTTAIHFLPAKGMAVQGAGILELSIALNVLYLAVKNFSTLKWEEMGKGLAGVGGSLTAIVLAMRSLPVKGLIGQATGLVIVAGALMLLGKAIKQMGGNDWETLGKGVGTIAVALGILVGALRLMPQAMPGTMALLVMSGALTVLVPVLQSLGKMKWSQIVKGLVALGLALGTLGLAGALMAPVAPALMAVGAAITLIGVGIGAAAAGLGVFAMGLGMLAKYGSGGVAILLDAIEGLIQMIPEAAVKFAEGLVQFTKVIGENAPVIIGAFVKLLDELLTAVPKLMPKIVVAMNSFIQGLLKVIRDNAPGIIQAGLDLLMQLLSGIEKNIGKITTTVINIIVKFLNTLADNMPRIVTAGLNVLIKFLEGITKNLSRVVTAVGTLITTFVTEIGKLANRIITAGTNMIINLVLGLGKASVRLITAGVTAIIMFVQGLASAGVYLVRGAFQAVLNFLIGLHQAIDYYLPKIVAEGVKIGEGLLDGLIEGLKEGITGGKHNIIVDTVTDVAEATLNPFKKVLGLFSPSHVTYGYGGNVVQGLINGLDDNANRVKKSSRALGEKTLSGINDALSRSRFDSIIDAEPKITPVLDLSGVSRDASKINSMLQTKPIVATTSLQAASDIVVQRQLAATNVEDVPVVQQGDTIFKFEQTNTSPKALSTTEVYRNTKNLLGQARSVLGVPA